MSAPSLLTTCRDGPNLVLEIHGSIGSLAEDAALTKVDGIIAQVEQGEVRNVVVDFGQSPYFGSILLETLRRVWNAVHLRGGRMVLCNVSVVGREILEIARFHQLWPIVETRQEALRQLSSAS